MEICEHCTKRTLWIWSHLLKKSLMENFIFCAVESAQISKFQIVMTDRGERVQVMSVITILENFFRLLSLNFGEFADSLRKKIGVPENCHCSIEGSTQRHNLYLLLACVWSHSLMLVLYYDWDTISNHC